ncbi:MAG: 50S ribosomal protein L10 [Gammaproteobacteria bacterium]|nr:50S ribosomal protein L10 [Gammaproteobacteria bacterium]
MLTLQDKKAIVAEVSDVASSAQSAIAAEYRGLTVDEMTQLRAQARATGVKLRVVKNTLARRALKETDYACMTESLVGPLLLAFSLEEASSGAKLIHDFAKEHDNLKVKIVALAGKLLQPEDIKALASMPSRDEAIALFMAVMRAPIEKLVRTANEPVAKFVRTVAAVRDSKS